MGSNTAAVDVCIFGIGFWDPQVGGVMRLETNHLSDLNGQSWNINFSSTFSCQQDFSDNP